MITKDIDEATLYKFWQDEATLPQWFQDGSNAWGCSWEDFKEFANNCERIYLINDNALIYVENIDGQANVHISLLRGTTINIQDLKDIKADIHQTYPFIFGWVGRHNRGLKRMVTECGLQPNGLKMFYGKSHGRVMEWQCYSANFS